MSDEELENEVMLDKVDDGSMSQLDYHLKSFTRSLKKRFLARREWSRLEQISAYRIFDREHNIPLTVDLFNEKYAVVTAYLTKQEESNFAVPAYLEVVHKALNIAEDRLFYKPRVKGRREGWHKPEGETQWTWVKEQGLEFKLNLTDYLDIGLFLDHRVLRGRVADESAGKRVLNLFCYTGSFSAYAASGGATKVMSVDLSQNYLDWAKENMLNNGFLGPQFIYERADVLSWLQDAVDAGQQYDLIICDPPIFSNSRQMTHTLNIQRDHVGLINLCMRLLTPKGLLYFSTPLANLEFQARMIDGVCKEITTTTIPYDFRRGHPHRSWRIESYRTFKLRGEAGLKRQNRYSSPQSQSMRR
jgi:23S rRNA (cytosine1962-C5)-methyltransferase